MRKRLLSIVTALCLCFTMMPAAAFAEDTGYSAGRLFVGSSTSIQGDKPKSGTAGEGTWSYDGRGTLTLTNCSFTEDMYTTYGEGFSNYRAAIRAKDMPLTIVLEGKNTITGKKAMTYIPADKNENDGENDDDYRISEGISAKDGLTVKGSGSLEIKCNNGAIHSLSYLIVDIGDGYLKCDTNRDAIIAQGHMQLKSGNVYANATGTELGYFGVAAGNLTVDSGLLEASSNGCYYLSEQPSNPTPGNPAGIAVGFFGGNGTLTVNGGTVKGTANGANNSKDGSKGYGIYAGTLWVSKPDENGRTQAAEVYGYAGAADAKDKKSGNAGENGIHLSTALYVLEKGYVFGKTYNTEKSGIQAAISLGNSTNQTAIVTKPLAAAPDGSGVFKKGGSPAGEVEITGLRHCTLTLGETEGTKWVKCGRGSDKDAGDNYVSYSEDFDLKRNDVLYKALSYQFLKNIVIKNGEHSIILDGVNIESEADDTAYISVSDNAVLNLKLKKCSILRSKSTPISLGTSAELKVKGAIENSVYPSISLISSNSASYAVGGILYPSVSVEDCVLLADGGNNGDINADLSIKGGGYVQADLANNRSLSMNGGSFVGKSTELFFEEKPAVTLKSGYGNIQLTNVKEIKVLDKDGKELCPVEVTLYDEYDQFKSQVYETKVRQLINNEVQEETWKLRRVTSLSVARAGNLGKVETNGDVLLRIPESEQDYCKLTLYLPAGDHVTEAKINGPKNSTTVSYWSSAAKEQQLIAKSTEKVSGVLYTAGALLMRGVMALRGAESYDDNTKLVRQVSPDHNANENAYWIDYEKMGYNIFEIRNPEGYENSTVTGYSLNVKSFEHRIFVDGLWLAPKEGKSCVVFDEWKEGSDERLKPKLELSVNITPSRGVANKLESTSEPVFNLGSGGTLHIQSVALDPTDSSKMIPTAGGKLKLMGSEAFGNTDGSNLVIENMTVENKCASEQKDTHNYASLTIKNSTVIGLGKVTGKVTIDGGSVDLDCTTVTNSKGEQLTKTVLGFTGSNGDKKVESLELVDANGGTVGEEIFDTSNISTDSNGRITLWLPAGVNVKSAKIDSKTYYPVPEGGGKGYELAIATAVSITSPTTDQSVLLGSELSYKLSVNAYGAPAPEYYWEQSTDGGKTWQVADKSFIQSSAGFHKDSTFTLGVGSVNSGDKFRCKVSNSYPNEQGQTVKSELISPIFTAYCLPTASLSAPQGTTVKSGARATFAVTTSETLPGLTVSYRWQYSMDGESWTDIEDSDAGAEYKPEITADMDGQKLRCELSYTAADGNCRSIYTDVLSLTVVKAPSFSKQPESKTIKTGESAVFEAAASGANSLSYRWQYSDDGKAWTDIEGETSTSYTVSEAADSLNGRQYRCVAVNSLNGVANELPSSAATLEVVAVPSITAQPQDTAAYINDSATISVTVTGNQTLSYRWQVKKLDAEGAVIQDWADIYGATEASCTIDKASLDMNGWLYRCIITSSANGVSQELTSNEAKLSVHRRSQIPLKKPTVSIDEDNSGSASQGTATLSEDGSLLNIEPEEGYEIAAVTLNGVDMGAVSELTGLKPSDIILVSFKAKGGASGTTDVLSTVKKHLSKLQLTARSVKTAKKNIKLTLKTDKQSDEAIAAIKKLGFTVKYKFYRSTKKSSGYKAMLTKTGKTYTNTSGKKGTKYYYKVQVRVYDENGKCVAKTALKQCKYASRTWTK